MAEEYSIAPGFNNVAGYVVIHTTIVSTKLLAHVQGVGTYDSGEERVFIDGTHDDVGEGLFTWLFTRMTWAQYEWFIATPNAGRRSNRVTARTRLNGAAWVNTNAILTMPKTAQLTRTFGWYIDVPCLFNLVAII